MIKTFHCCISFLNLGQFITVQWPGATTGGLQEPCWSMTSQGESSNFFLSVVCKYMTIYWAWGFQIWKFLYDNCVFTVIWIYLKLLWYLILVLMKSLCTSTCIFWEDVLLVKLQHACLKDANKFWNILTVERPTMPWQTGWQMRGPWPVQTSSSC